MRNIQWYGWNKDLPSRKDRFYSAYLASEVETLQNLPKSVNLQYHMPPVYNQKELGSCTANAVAAGIQYLHSALPPSRLFIYYNERMLEGTIPSDCGGQLRDAIKAVAIYGACDERYWPYEISKFADKPSDNAYALAKNDVVTKYLRVVGIQEMKSCLAAGFPFVFGFMVYDSFESEGVARTGIMSIPSDSEKSVGGHAVIAVGYDDRSQMFLIRNSWGVDWGQGGYFWMPYSFISNPCYCADFWTIRAEGKV